MISLGGDWFLMVAMQDLILALTGSGFLSSLVMACYSLPSFLSAPLAGHLIDKLDRRRLMVVVNCICAVAALLPLLSTRKELLLFGYLGILILSAGSAFIGPTADAALPNLVDPKDLRQANALFNSTWGTMLVIGSALGGLWTHVLGGRSAFVVDALSFLLSGFLVAQIRTPFSQKHTKDQSLPLAQAVSEALGYAQKHRRVLALLLVKGGYGLATGCVAMLAIFGREIFLQGAAGIGWLYTARGLGALLGPFLVQWIISHTGKDHLRYSAIGPCIALLGIGYAGLAFSPTLLVGALAVLVAHLGGGAQWTLSTTALQQEVPDSLRGRILALDYGFFTLTMTLSTLLAGASADLLGARSSTALVSSLALLWGLVWGIWTYRLWRLAPRRETGVS